MGVHLILTQRYFGQNCNAFYTLILFYFKSIKHVLNSFFISSKYNQNTLKTDNNPTTFQSNGSKPFFNLKKNSVNGIQIKLIFSPPKQNRFEESLMIP